MTISPNGGNKGLFRRCLVGVTEAVVVNSKIVESQNRR